MKYFSLLLLLATSLFAAGQRAFDPSKLSSKTKTLVAKIAKVNELVSSNVYDAVIRPKQHDNYIRLYQSATEQELVELTNHPNGVVRCYAFWSLANDKTFDLLPIVINHLNDTTLISTQFGCLGGSEKVGDVFIEEATGKLSSQKQKILDSLLVFTPNSLLSKHQALKRWQPNEALYQRAKYIYQTEHNQDALLVLAGFQKEEDIPLIIANREKGRDGEGYSFTYKAIQKFQHPSFLPLLQKNLKAVLAYNSWDGEWAGLYETIAQYKNDSALQLLLTADDAASGDMREYHTRFMFWAMQSFYTPLYDDLFWKLWEKDNKTSVQIALQLYEEDPASALVLMEKNLRNADELYSLFAGGFGENPSRMLLHVMLDTLIKYNKPIAIEIINKNLREINVHHFPVFAEYAFKLKDKSFIESFFARLEKEDNPHVYLQTAKILIAYNEKNITNRLLATSYKNKSMRTGWGGKEFIALVKNIESKPGKTATTPNR